MPWGVGWGKGLTKESCPETLVPGHRTQFLILVTKRCKLPSHRSPAQNMFYCFNFMTDLSIYIHAFQSLLFQPPMTC